MNLTGLPGISGMVKVAANHFLVVHDTKGPLGSRLGIIDIKTDGPRYQEVGIPNWPSSEPLPNDVEGVCAIPERPGEYLVVESGFYPKYGDFGRVIKIGYREGTPLIAEFLGSFRPFPPPANNSETPKHEQIEGIAAVAQGGTTALLFALRGFTEKPEKPGSRKIPGQLVWGTLTDIEKANPKFKKKGRRPLSPHAIADRGAADLFTRACADSANEWEVLSVASVDSGDLGPFRSSVYLAGSLTISSGDIEFTLETSCKNVLWDFECLKVEALAERAELFKDTSELSIATDDEFYKGIWRPVLKSPGLEPPSEMLFIENVLAKSKSR